MDLTPVILDLDDTMGEFASLAYERLNLHLGRDLKVEDSDDFDLAGRYGLQPAELMELCSELHVFQDMVPTTGLVQRMHDMSHVLKYQIITGRGLLPRAWEITDRWLTHWCFPSCDLVVVKPNASKADYADPQAIAAFEDHAGHLTAYSADYRKFLVAQPWNRKAEGCHFRIDRRMVPRMLLTVAAYAAQRGRT